MLPQRYQVGVVGFGVAGGALACLLGRMGHAVTIFEQAPTVGPVGTGLLLQPSGQGVLERLGLLDGIAAQSEPIHELHAFQPDGRTLIHLRYDEIAPGCRAYGIHRGTLFQALHSRAAAEPNVCIHLNHAIASWRPGSDGRQVFAVDAAGAAHGPFDFLVAADGSRSRLRQTLEPGLAGVPEYPIGALWTVGRCTQVRGYLHQVVEGTRHLLGLLPIGGERATLFWSLPQREMDDLRAGGFAAWREAAVRLCPLADEVLADAGGFERVVFTTYRHTVLRRPHNAHVVCLGDAAHAMSPHLGQGANLALLDAECLADALATAEGVRAAFQRYEADRRAHVRYYATLSRLLTPFFQSEGWLLGLGRDIALPRMSCVPPLRHHMLLAMAGVKRGLLGGTLPLPSSPPAP